VAKVICSSDQPLFVRGGVAETATPLNDSTPAGATDAGIGARTESSSAFFNARSLSGNCRDGHEARPVEGKPTDGGDGCRQDVPKLESALDNRQGDETRIVTLLYSHQDAALTFRTCTRNNFANLCGR
jgi:hypothetical protein